MNHPKLGREYRDKETKLRYTYFTNNEHNELVMVYTTNQVQLVALDIFWDVFESVD